MVDNSPAIQDLLAWVETQVPRLSEEACASVLAQIPLYRADTPVSAEELRQWVERNLRYFVTAIASPEQPGDLAAPTETGRRRALQRVPLPEVLQAYRISFATLWQALVQRADESNQTSTSVELLNASNRIWRLVNEHAIAVTEGYRKTAAEQMLSQQRRRAALVEALLTGHPGLESNPWEAAALLGFPEGSTFIVVASDTIGLAQEGLPGIEGRLSLRRLVSAWRLTPARQLGVVALDEEQEREGVLDDLRAVAKARVGVSPSFRSLSDAPRALHLAQSALQTVPRSVIDVHVFGPSPLAAMVVCEPVESSRLAHQVLGAVIGLRSDERDKLLQTLNTYLDHGGSVARTAAVLYFHENTVRNRLRRLEQLTGRSLSNPSDIAEIAAAAMVLRLRAADDAVWRVDR